MTDAKKVISKVYDYRDESGELLHQTVRYSPKSFSQRRPDGNGGWFWNLRDTRIILYRLQELIQAPPDAWVVICEGEKDVDNLIKLGLIATTAPMGTAKWRDNFTEFFSDKQRVALLPDNDAAGRKHAENIATQLLKFGGDIRLVALEDIPAKGDVSDYLDNGHTKDDLLDAIENTKPFTPGRETVVTDFNLTDAGNAERLAFNFGDKLRYCWDWRCWLFYDGKRWNKNRGDELARKFALETVRSILDEATKAGELERRQVLAKWSFASETASRLSATLQVARAVNPFPIYAIEFDCDPWLLNCLNGTLDLRTGILRQHNPADLITKICPVNFDPNATLDAWDDFLKTATNNNISMMEFLQRAAGYSLTGDTGEGKLFFIHGPTASGKSTFVEAIENVLGDYAITSDFSTFLQRGFGGGIRNDIARLDGCRLVASIEVQDGKRLATGLVKMLTGGDTVSARFLHQEFFDFKPQFKLWLAANHTPRITDDDDAIWRRILLVPFIHSIPEPKQNPEIKKLLVNPVKAGPAILAWMIRGCLAWQKDRLKIPDVVRLATREYRENEDPLKDFFDDECEFNSDAIISVRRLKIRYVEYCSENGIKHPLRPRLFNARLRNRGCEDGQMRWQGKVQKVWVGIELREKEPEGCNQT